jgi:hypothetical protein
VRLFRLGAAVCLGLALTAALIWLPSLVTNGESLKAAARLELENGVRQTIIQLAAVIGAAIGGAVGLRTYYLNRQSAATARLQQGVEDLASGDSIKRVGAILALGRVAKESRDDYWQVMTLLLTHLKRVAPRAPSQPAASIRERDALASLVRTRPAKWESSTEILDLSELDLNGIDLRASKLRRALLRGSALEGAHLGKADLRQATLSPDVSLKNAHMQRADLRGADLRGANLEGADLRRCDLRGVKLSGVRWGEQLDAAGAKGLPPHLQGQVRKR